MLFTAVNMVTWLSMQISLVNHDLYLFLVKIVLLLETINYASNFRTYNILCCVIT